jgi:hypothetical protein
MHRPENSSQVTLDFGVLMSDGRSNSYGQNVVTDFIAIEKSIIDPVMSQQTIS